jgi:aldose 1-epimerase
MPGVSALAPSGEQFELRHASQRVVVVEVGGGLRTYRAGEREVLDGYGPDEMAGGGRGQALMPWPNRLRDGRYEFGGRTLQLALSEPDTHNAIHGLVRWTNWIATEREPARVRMEHVLHPQTGYPFTLALAIEYVLDDGGLTVTTEATNAGGEPCPFGAGAHPYLTVGTASIDGCTLQAPGARRLLADERSLPTGSEAVAGTAFDFRRARTIGDAQIDTAYTELERDADGLARTQLVAPDGRTGVTLWQDASYTHLMLFTGDTLPPERRRQGLAVEPMTCPPNAFASGEGVRVLAPGETFTARWGIAPTRG